MAQQQVHGMPGEQAAGELRSVELRQRGCSYGVQVGLFDPAGPELREDVDEGADQGVLLLREGVGVRGDGRGVGVARGVVADRGVRVAALLAQLAEQLLAQDLGEQARFGGTGHDRGQDDAGIVAREVGGGGGQRGGGRGGRVPLAPREREGEALGDAVAGDPQDGVLGGEPGLRPGADVVPGQAVQARLGVAGESVRAGAVAPQGGGVGRAVALAGGLGAQDPLLGLQPVRREVAQRRAHAVEVLDHVGGSAGGVEVGVRGGGGAVVVQVAEAVPVQGQVLDQMGDAAGGEGFVGASDAEEEPGGEEPRAGGEDGADAVHGGRGDAVGLGRLHGVPLSPWPGRSCGGG